MFAIGGTVAGLSGSGPKIHNNSGDDLVISANGDFSFSVELEGLSAYSVTVVSQPTNPKQMNNKVI